MAKTWVEMVEELCSSELGRLDRLTAKRFEVNNNKAIPADVRELALNGIEVEFTAIKKQIGDHIWSLHLAAQDNKKE